ncbi:MAG: ArnT family glycosyltransferase [Ilumatobacteraceae bacterium]
MRADWKRIGLLFALAFVLRAAWVLAVDRVGFVLNDALLYHSLASGIVDGKGFVDLTGQPMAQWPPGFPGLLAFLYWVFGKRPVVGELCNALIGAITVVVLYFAVDRALGRKVATVSAVILCVMPGPILWTDMLLSETLLTFVFVCFFALVVRSRPTWAWAVALGAVIGLGVMVRGEALTWGLVPLVLWYREVPWRTWLPRMALTGLVVLLAMTPWTIRNARAMGAFVPLATNSSSTLWVGHNPNATGAQMYPTSEFYEQFGTEQPARELDSANALRSEAIRYMLTHPVDEVRLIPWKITAMFRGDSYAFDWVNAAPEPPLLGIHVERIGTAADAAWFALVAFTALGVVGLGRAAWRQPMLRAIATSLATMLFLYGFLYYGNYRYRLPYTPLMIVVAALVFSKCWSTLRSPAAEAEVVT